MNIFMKLSILCMSFTLLAVVPQAQNTTALPNDYTLSINVESDRDSFTNFTFSLLKSGKVTPIPYNEVSRYSLITFNRPKDILWAPCAEGYRLSKATSKSGTHIIHDPIIGAGIVFSERRSYKTYNLTIFCFKKASISQDWDTFWNAFRAAVRKRDKLALKRMMIVKFNSAAGKSYSNPDARAAALQDLDWHHLDEVIRQGIGPLRKERNTTVRQAPPSLNDVGMVAFFELGKDGRWRWADFYFYH